MRNTILNEQKTYTMYSFDVENLYTNVPVNEAINVTIDYMYKPNKLINVPFNRSQMKKLLELSACDAPFGFQNKLFKQVDVVAMGNPLAPVLADLRLQEIEQKLNKFSTNKPIIWLNYIDNIYCLLVFLKTKFLNFIHESTNGTIIYISQSNLNPITLFLFLTLLSLWRKTNL